MLKRFLLLAIVTLLGTSVYAAGYCPAYQEMKAKNYSYPQRLRTLAMKTPSDSTLAEMDRILAEQQAFYQSIISGCTEYFMTTQNPDCSRVGNISGGYAALTDTAKQAAALSKINAATSQIIKKCPNEAKSMFMFIR